MFQEIPSRELTYPTKREKENHLQNAIFGGYVSFLEGTSTSTKVEDRLKGVMKLILLMVQNSGLPVGRRFLPLFTSVLAPSQVVGNGISEPSPPVHAPWIL